MYEGPGLYQHYKGDYYRVHGLSIGKALKDSQGNRFNPDDDKYIEVVYEPRDRQRSLLIGSKTRFWLCDLREFNETVLVPNPEFDPDKEATASATNSIGKFTDADQPIALSKRDVSNIAPEPSESVSNCPRIRVDRYVRIEN